MPQDRRVPVFEALAALGISRAAVLERRLPFFTEAARLASVGLGVDGRDKFLQPAARQGWLDMRAEAAVDGVSLLLVSAFRSHDYQLSLLKVRLARGETVEQALSVLAPPGYSEHHSGRAVDIGTPGCGGLDEAFERTPAFAWLQANAHRYGFALSYPRGNAGGFIYEPWHWCYSAARAKAGRQSPSSLSDLG